MTTWCEKMRGLLWCAGGQRKGNERPVGKGEKIDRRGDDGVACGHLRWRIGAGIVFPLLRERVCT